MSKRFTDTLKWSDPWFRELPQEYQRLWLFILDACDNAGIWKVDMKLASFMLNAQLTQFDAEIYMEDRVIPFGKQQEFNGQMMREKWFIPKFVTFQYGKLNPACKPHKYVLDILMENGLGCYAHANSIALADDSIEGYPKGIHTLKEKDKDKEKEKEILAPLKPAFDFEEIWGGYPKKLGRGHAEKHFKATVKTEEDYRNIKLALSNYIAYLSKNKTEEKYIKYGSTWFNCWRDWVNANQQTELKQVRKNLNRPWSMSFDKSMGVPDGFQSDYPDGRYPGPIVYPADGKRVA